MIAAVLDDHDPVEKVEYLRPLSPTSYTTSAAEHMAEIPMVLQYRHCVLTDGLLQKTRSQCHTGTIHPLAIQHLQQTHHCCKVPE